MVKIVKLDEILSDDNRKYTKEEGFEQFVESIRKHGIIEPPVLRKLKEGGYRIVAGRRRRAALLKLAEEDQKWAEVECVIKGADDTAGDEEIALAENVNRLEMHPLDEAALFIRMADKGADVKEIAKYYARSPSAIYKRMRLGGLTEELKGMFRDGRLNIAGAAVLAELPDEDQKDFFELYKTPSVSGDEIESSRITQFVQKKQRFTIKECMEGCKGCEKRTHNEGNDLFEEYEYLSDVCLDADCYRGKWYEMINQALVKKIKKDGPADAKIMFRQGPPELLYKKATHVDFSDLKGSLFRFQILRDKDYEFTGKTDRKKDTCWQVCVLHDGSLSIERIGYKEKPLKEKSVTANGVDKDDNTRIESYGREALEAAAAERVMPVAELAKALEKKGVYSYYFSNEIEEEIFDSVINKRVEMEKAGTRPRDYFSMFFQLLDEEYYGSGICVEKNFDNWQKLKWKDLVGGKSMKQVTADLTDEIQKVFHFLLISNEDFERNVPSIDDLKGIEKSNNTFWQYAGMSKEEYKALYLQAAKEVTARAMDTKAKKNSKNTLLKKQSKEEEYKALYLEAAKEVAADALKPNAKKDGKKKSAGKKSKEDAADEADDEDNYPFEPAPENELDAETGDWVK